jgi:hypothetical protein
VTEEHDYITQTAHGTYPAGSACVVRIDGDTLHLRFEDGNTLTLERKHWYLMDIERRPYWEEAMHELRKQEDAKFIALIDEVIAAGKVK